MSWTDLIIDVEKKYAKTAEIIALQCTSLGIYIEDYTDIERTLHLIGTVDYIDKELTSKNITQVSIHIYIPPDESPEQVILKISELLNTEGIKFDHRCEILNETDWENDWKKFHKPHRVGNRIVICPSWEEYKKGNNDVVLTIDPASSFGSGKDETTRVCLKLIESYLSVGDKILDIGCGSGVLSIAALLLGGKSAVGVDIDKNAVNASIDNARINNLGDCFEGRCGNVLTDCNFEKALGDGYDLICANIVADVHIAMKSFYFKKLKNGGKLILSGIINSRAIEVRSVIELVGFSFIQSEDEDGWTGLVFEKIYVD